MKVDLGRPLAASLLFAALLTAGLLALAAGWENLTAAQAERDAKIDFVSRGVAASRRPPQPGAPANAPRLFVMAESETLAASTIDTLVRRIVTEDGGSVLSSRADAKHDEAGISGRIEVQAVIEAQNDEVQSILFKIESGAPMMLIDALELQPIGGPSDAPGADVSPRLHATLTLSAYWKAAQK